MYTFPGTRPTRDISSLVRSFEIEKAFRNLIPDQKPRRVARNGNPPKSDHPCQLTTQPIRILRSVANTLLVKRKLITVFQILLHLHMQPAGLRNSLLPVLLGITSFSNNSNRLRVHTMANNPYIASSNQSLTLLINSANSMSLDRRDSDSKPPTSSLPLLIHWSCKSLLRRLSYLQMRP